MLPPALEANKKVVNGFYPDLTIARASKPGGDLLFHCLSTSTIGAVWFHGRVRDGIGWVTDAMATKLWDLRANVLETVHYLTELRLR